MMNHATAETLRRMNLLGMAEAFREQLGKDAEGLSFEERFGLIVDHEWTHRQDRRLARLIKDAKFRLPAAVEDIDFHQPRGLDRHLIRSLATGDWIRQHLNVIITGATGAGKTFLACALGNAACRQGFSARYYRLSRLLDELTLAKADGTYQKLLQRLAKFEVLILDDMGLKNLSAPEGRDLLEVLDDRIQLRSTIVASQFPVADWHATITDPSVADAILDRLVHSAHRFELKGESMRKVRGAGSRLETSVTSDVSKANLEEQ